MDFQFFESMTAAEAEEFLANYLRLQEEAWQEMQVRAKKAGIDANFSFDSVRPVLEWIVKQVTIVPSEPDPNLPSWIKETPSYIKGLFDFDETSGILVVRASYYLGSVFVAHCGGLSWATGRIDTAEQNMPVVTGFAHGLELATMLVTENLCRRILAGEADYTTIDEAVDYWRSQIGPPT